MAEPTSSTSPETKRERSVHALYTGIVSKLDGFLYGGETMSKDPDLDAAPTLVTALVQLRIWAADIGAQKDESVLDSLEKDAPGLGAKVRGRLEAIRDAIANFEAVIQSNETDRIEGPDDLKSSSYDISIAITSLTWLADAILKQRREIVGNDLASSVRSVLDWRSAPSSKQDRPEDVFDDIDSLGSGELVYSDEESGHRTQRRIFQRHKPDIVTANRFADLVETHIMPKIRASRAIQTRTSTSPRFPPISPDQTRLATLFPGQFEDPISFSVEVISINGLQNYDYEAVSYDRNFNKTGNVDISMVPHYDDEDVRERETQSLFILSHAADALRRIRRKDMAVTIWIDALCMDLSNEEEKLAQSQCHAPIFAHARRVYMWIGKHPRQGFISFRWIKQLITFENPEYLDLDSNPGGDWGDFLFFMNLDIFRQSCIVQEIVVAKQVTVLRHNDQLDWDELSDAVILWQRAKSTNPRLAFELYMDVSGLEDQKTSAERLVHVRQYLNQKRATGADISAEEFVLSLSWTKDARPWDCIYASIGFGWGNAKAALMGWPWSPTSGSSLNNSFLSDRTIAMRFVARSIKMTGSLDIILWPWAPRSTRGSLPSWIQMHKGPRRAQVSFVGPPGQKEQLYNASASVYPSYRFSDDKAPHYTFSRPIKGLNRAFVLTILAELDFISHHHSLLVDGIEIGTIDKLSPRMSYDGVALEDLQLISQDLKELTISKPGFLESDFGLESLCRILVADRTSAGDRVPAWYSRVIAMRLKTAGSYLRFNTYPGTPGAISEVLSRVQDVILNRTLIRTSNNLVGLAPAETRKGDNVCVLSGCSVPVVLRRRNETSPSYELIGECFVDGFMDGKAMESGAEARQFMLV